MIGQNHSFEGRGKEKECSNFIRAKIMKVSPSGGVGRGRKEEERKEGRGQGDIIFYLLIYKCN